MESRESGQYLAFLTEKCLVNKRTIIWKLFLFFFPVSKMTYPSCCGINCYPCLIDANVHYRFLFFPYHFIKLPWPTDSGILKIYLHQVIFRCIVFCCVVLCCVIFCFVVFCYVVFNFVVLHCGVVLFAALYTF